jgi:hypothetical protein
MPKSLQIVVSIIGLIAAIVYILNFFRVFYHPAIPAITAGIVIFSYLFGIYAKKNKDN